MAYTTYYGTSAIYTNDMAVFLNTSLLLVVYSKTSVYGTLAATVLRYIIVLYSYWADNNEELIQRMCLQRWWRKQRRKRLWKWFVHAVTVAVTRWCAPTSSWIDQHQTVFFRTICIVFLGWGLIRTLGESFIYRIRIYETVFDPPFGQIFHLASDASVPSVYHVAAAALAPLQL